MTSLTKYFFCYKKNLSLWIFFSKTTIFLKATRSTNQTVKINVEMSKTQPKYQTRIDQATVPRSKCIRKSYRKVELFSVKLQA